MKTTNNAVSTTPASPPSQGFGQMNQLASGPAALLYTLSNELIQIYNELEESYNQMTKAEVSVQKDTILVAAQEQRSTASAEAAAYWCQMGATLAGAAITAATAILETKNNAKNNTKLDTHEGELKQLNALKEMAPPTGNVSVGNAPGAPNPAAQTRATEMAKGNFSLNEAGNTPAEIAARNTRNQEAIDKMKPDEHVNYRKELQTQIESKQRDINNTNLDRTHNSTSYQQKSQLFSSLANSAGQAGQAIYKGQSGEHQASQQVNSGVTSMTNGTAETTRSNIGSNYAKVSEVINSARQGAQTYANT